MPEPPAAPRSPYLALQARGDGTLVRVLPEKVSEFEADLIRNEAIAAVAAGRTRLAIDLSGVELLTSAGMGALISIDRECRSRGGRTALFGLSDQLLGLLRTTRLDRIFTVQPDEASALAALR
jgi:anti-sigma B factor antagonist